MPISFQANSFYKVTISVIMICMLGLTAKSLYLFWSVDLAYGEVPNRILFTILFITTASIAILLWMACFERITMNSQNLIVGKLFTREFVSWPDIRKIKILQLGQSCGARDPLALVIIHLKDKSIIYFISVAFSLSDVLDHMRLMVQKNQGNAAVREVFEQK